MFGLSKKFFATTISTPLPPGIPIERAITILHDFEVLHSMNPTWRRTKRKAHSASRHFTLESGVLHHHEYWEVEEEVTWIPKWLWSGTAKYNLEFTPTTNGCDVKIWANWRFTSVDRWRLFQGRVLNDGEVVLDDPDNRGWVLQTGSDTVYHRTFARLMNRHAPVDLKSVHVRLIDRLQGNVS